MKVYKPRVNGDGGSSGSGTKFSRGSSGNSGGAKKTSGVPSGSSGVSGTVKTGGVERNGVGSSGGGKEMSGSVGVERKGGEGENGTCGGALLMKGFGGDSHGNVGI